MSQPENDPAIRHGGASPYYPCVALQRLWLTVLPLSILAAVPCLGLDSIGFPITEIRFDPPLSASVRALAERGLRIQVGQPLRPETLRESIHALFRTGRFADIQADAERVGEGVRLTFLTEPAWFVGNVRVVGVPRPPSEGQLVNATQLRLGELFTEEKLGQALRSVRALLVEHGYRQPVVDHRLVRDASTQQAHLELNVAVGPRARIGALLVVGTNQPLTGAEMRTIARWPRGVEYRRDRLQRGIGLLREHFQDQDLWRSAIRVEVAEHRPSDNELTLVAEIEPGPKMLVRIEGAGARDTRLRRFLPIYARGVVDDDLLAAGSENLKNYFQSRGYFGATVEYEVESETAERISIAYRVNRGRRQVLRAVEISGNRFFDTTTIRERMELQERGPGARHGEYSRALLEQDLRAIGQLYSSNGYRDTEVSGQLVEGYLGQPNDLAVRIDIEEGAPTVVTGLVTAGFADFPVSEAEFDFASAPGQPFSEANVASDRQRILAEYFNDGYQQVAFNWRAEEGRSPHEAVVYYEVDQGEPIRTGEVFLSGSRRTRETVLARRTDLVPGGPLSQASMFATQRNLYDLGVFSKVEVALQNPDGVEQSKNVLVQVEEARRWAVGVGGGAEFARIGRNTAELTNPAGDATFSPRVTLEVTRLNVRGKAHTMGFRTRLSLLQQRGLFTYEAPRWFDSDRWRLTVSGLYDTFRNVNTFTGRRLEGAIQLTQQMNTRTTVLYRYAYRRTSVDENTLNIEPLLVPLISQPVRVGFISGTYISDRRDDPTDTTKGIYNTVNVALASKYFGAQPNFARLLAQNSTYHRLRSRVVFARTMQLGVNLPWAGHGVEGVQFARFAGRPDPRIPLSERYFGGGANSHRGFAYNQAGPRDPATGFPLGGGSQFLNSLELRFPLIGSDISGVLFHDAGNVYSRPGRISFRSNQHVRVNDMGTKEFDFDYMVHALGLGIRYRTPIGPVRFDLAFSPNPPRFVGFDGTREQLLTGMGTFREQRIPALQFHFSLGQTF